MRRLTVCLGLIAMLTSTGCLQKDTSSTIYVRSDGTLDWTIRDMNVRSDESEPGAQFNEEQAFINAIWSGQDSLTKGLRAAGGTNVTALVLQDQAPFDVVRSARFDSFKRWSQIFERPLKACGVPYRSSFKTDALVTTWTLAVRVEPEPDAPDGCEGDGLTSWLADATEHLRIVVESARFTAVTGFTILAPDTVEIEEPSSDSTKRNDGWVVYSLTWTRVQ